MNDQQQEVRKNVITTIDNRKAERIKKNDLPYSRTSDKPTPNLSKFWSRQIFLVMSLFVISLNNFFQFRFPFTQYLDLYAFSQSQSNTPSSSSSTTSSTTSYAKDEMQQYVEIINPLLVPSSDPFAEETVTARTAMKKKQTHEETEEERLSYYFNNTIPKPDPEYVTGSFADCKPDDENISEASKLPDLHPDASNVIISCRKVNFRAPLSRIQQSTSKIIIGVLSAAEGDGPKRRQIIRSTWAKNREVYFLVAGDWAAIEAEYMIYHDLIWLDEKELYFDGEHSVLPYKTEVFVHVVNKFSSTGKNGIEYMFKTDDDCYVDVKALEKELVGAEDIHYWGCCTNQHYRPLRHPSREFRVTFDLYPETYYPLYCQGAGFAISRKMSQCITREENMQNVRFLPFEDAAIGLLAERCGYPLKSDCEKVSQYRSSDPSELKILKNQKISGDLPQATMIGKIVQHRVKTAQDMLRHHYCVVQESC